MLMKQYYFLMLFLLGSCLISLSIRAADSNNMEDKSSKKVLKWGKLDSNPPLIKD